MKRSKKFISAFIGICMAVVPLTSFWTVTVSADEGESLQQQLDELEEKNKQYQAVLDKTQSDIDAKVEYKAALVSKIEVLNSKMALTHQSIDELNTTISQKQADIEQANVDLSTQIDAFCKRLKTIYMAGNVTDIEIILGAKDFSDFVDKLQLIKTLSNYDKNLIDTINEKLAVVSEQKASLENDKTALDAQQESLESDQQDLNKLLEENDAILRDLYASNADAKSSLANSVLESEEIEKQISDYYASVAAAAAANARIGINEKLPTINSSSQESESSSESSSVTVDSSESASSSEQESSSSSGSESSSQTNTTTSSSSSNSSSDSSSNNSSNNNDITASGYVWPCPGYYYLSSEWNEDRGYYNHGAIDIAGSGIMGANVVAADSGVVIATYNGCTHNWGKDTSCGCGGGYGNYVMIDHGNGKMTVYGHFSSVAVSTGDVVTKGQTIGYVGSTGNSTGPHLHFECRLYGEKYNPMLEY